MANIGQTLSPEAMRVIVMHARKMANILMIFVILAEKHSPTIDKYIKNGECL